LKINRENKQGIRAMSVDGDGPAYAGSAIFASSHYLATEVRAFVDFATEKFAKHTKNLAEVILLGTAERRYSGVSDCICRIKACHFGDGPAFGKFARGAVYF
jgi:hypothetical protein